MGTNALGGSRYLLNLERRLGQASVLADGCSVAVKVVNLSERQLRILGIALKHCNDVTHVNLLVCYGGNDLVGLLGDEIVTAVVGSHADLFQGESVECSGLGCQTTGEVLELLRIEHLLNLLVEFVDNLHGDTFLLELLYGLAKLLHLVAQVLVVLD